MEQIALAVQRRTQTKKGGSRKLRAAGLIPAVVYSAGGAAEILEVDTRELDRVLRHGSGESAFLSLQLPDEAPRMAVLKEVQFDYMGVKVQHADFYEVRADQDITLDIPIELTGDAKGIKDGGFINQAAYHLPLTGKVAQLPDVVTVDISGLGLGDSLHAQALALPEGVSLASDEDFVVVSCSEPSSAAAGGAEAGQGEEGEDTEAD